MRKVVSVSLLAERLLDGFNLVWCKVEASGARVFRVTSSVDDAIHMQVPAGHGTIACSVSVVVGTSLVPLGALLGAHDDEEGKRRSIQLVIFCFFFLFGPSSLHRKDTMK